ncbi:MAG: TIM barrel protein [Bacteroides sp.]
MIHKLLSVCIVCFFLFPLSAQTVTNSPLDSWKVGTANDDVLMDMTHQELKEMKENGMDYLEVDWLYSTHTPMPEIEAWAKGIRERVKKNKVTVWSVHIPFGGRYDISQTDEKARQEALRLNMQDMEVSARILKPACFIVHPSAEPIAVEERSARIAASRKSLEKLALKAKQLGVKLLVENLPRTCLGNTSVELLQIIEGLSNTAICFDVNHLLIESHDLFVQHTAGKIGSTHMSDYDRLNERHWLADTGVINWDRLLQGLVSTGYKGPFIYEVGVGKQNVTIRDLGDTWKKLKATYTATTQLNVLQMNIWQEGTSVAGGFEAIADEVVRSEADIVFFSEIRDYNGQAFMLRILEALKQRGVDYHGKSCKLDVGILSKYPIETVCPVEGVEDRSVLKAIIAVGDNRVAAYSAHLDYTNYACYLPRGYSGTTWKKLPNPVANADSVVRANRLSRRDEAIAVVIKDIAKERAQGRLILLGGDFNEPSHLDWQAETKDLWNHNGLVVDWDCSSMLYQNGLKDSFRELHPNVREFPGFTFPSDNKDVAVNKLTWAPEVDERDRIDFIYYMPHSNLVLKESTVLGPSTSIVRSERVEEQGKERFITPKGVWPTDHKAVLTTFILR